MNNLSKYIFLPAIVALAVWLVVRLTTKTIERDARRREFLAFLHHWKEQLSRVPASRRDAPIDAAKVFQDGLPTLGEHLAKVRNDFKGNAAFWRLAEDLKLTEEDSHLTTLELWRRTSARVDSLIRFLEGN